MAAGEMKRFYGAKCSGAAIRRSSLHAAAEDQHPRQRAGPPGRTPRVSRLLPGSIRHRSKSPNTRTIASGVPGLETVQMPSGRRA
jgi:hypothetical protein